MKAISLFSGVGGFEIGLGRAGIETVLQVENDPWCLSVLERHWPDVQRVTDVRKVDATALQGRRRDVVSVGANSDAEWLGDAGRWRDNAAGADLVYGGWPCQGNSVAGKRAGLSDERSGLWHEVRRVLRELRPRWFIGENVPGLLSVNRGSDFLRVIMDLDNLGYGVAWRTVDARWFGVPQRRRRVFIVGCLGDAPRAAQVLAVCESCGGHPPPRGEAPEDVAHTLDDGARGASVELPMIAWDDRNQAALDDMPGRHHKDDENLVIARSLTARNERIDAETENFIVASPDRASDGHHGWSGGRGDGADNLITAEELNGKSSVPSEANARTLLQQLRDTVGEEAFTEWRSRVFDSLQPQEVLRPSLHGNSVRSATSEVRSELDDGTLACPKGVPAGALRTLWETASGSPSQRRELAEQLTDESSASMQELPHEGPPVSFGVRRLTPLEAERLQGWPDDWTRYTADDREIPDSHRYRMIGNGVVAPVAEWIGHRLLMANSFIEVAA